MITVPAKRLMSCGLLLALAAGGCASSRLAMNAPEGVNLSGEWVLNATLSDDSESLDALDKLGAKKKKKKDATPPAGEGSGDAAADIASATAVNTVPQRLSIKQDGPRFHIDSGNPPEPREYTTSAQASCSNDARCSAGWRGPVFVVDSHPEGKKAREETYALDSQGHLILTIESGNVYAKLAYDRDRPRT